MNENGQNVAQDDDDVVIHRLGSIDFSTDQYDDTESKETKNELYKVFLGGLIGATLGGIAGALLIKGTPQKINQTVKNVGDTVKGASNNLSQTVKNIGDAVNTITGNVNETVKDVGDNVKSTATNINETVISTADTVKGAASGMNETVTSTVDVVQSAVMDVRDRVKSTANNATTDASPYDGQTIKLPNDQKTYMLVPVEDDNKK